MFEYQCTIDRIVDGDTLDVIIDLGFYVKIKQRIRLARIDCPEKKTSKGEQSLAFLKPLIGHQAIVKTNKKDRYGRYIGEIMVDWNNEEKNLSDIIVEYGYGIYIK